MAFNTQVRQQLRALLLDDSCLCERGDPTCPQCIYGYLEAILTSVPLSPAVQHLITALLGYLNNDEDGCLCERCPLPSPLCQGCPYCIAWNALVAIAYVKCEETLEGK